MMKSLIKSRIANEKPNATREGILGYMGPAVSGGNIWYYWAQYTLTNNGWTFNNTTLEFITEEGSSYIGLIFWGSPPSMAVPTPAPDFPVA